VSCTTYLRVSSDEQTCETQRPAIERIVCARGYELVATYEEQPSATKPRRAFEQMMMGAHRASTAQAMDAVLPGSSGLYR